LPALRGYQYFLSGQDIAVVGPAGLVLALLVFRH
jgi:hypothetical protein